jgi:hypothetical protein
MSSSCYPIVALVLALLPALATDVAARSGASPPTVRAVRQAVDLNGDRMSDADFMAQVQFTRNSVAGVILLDAPRELVVIRITDGAIVSQGNDTTVVLQGLGYSIDGTGDRTAQSELIIFVTPTVIKPGGLLFEIVADDFSSTSIVADGKLHIPAGFRNKVVPSRVWSNFSP